MEAGMHGMQKHPLKPTADKQKHKLEGFMGKVVRKDLALLVKGAACAYFD